MPKAGVGDIVNLEGYGDEPYQVQAVYEETVTEEDDKYDVTTYDLTSVDDYRKFMIGFEKDITVVVPKENADQYIKKRRGEDSSGTDVTFQMLDLMTGEYYDITPNKGVDLNTSMQSFNEKDIINSLVSAEDQIDVLLDQLNDMNNAIAITGSEEDEDEFTQEIDEIKRRLAELSKERE